MNGGERTIPLLLLALACTGAAGCAYESKSKATNGNLSQAIRFVEIDERNRLVDHSSTELTTEQLLDGVAPARRIPDPGWVDINSSIQIKIDKDRLSSPAELSLTEARSRELLAQKEKLQRSLVGIREVIELRTRAVEAFAALQRAKAAGADVDAARRTFRRERREFAIREDAAIALIISAWESDPVGFVRIDEAAKDPTYRELLAVLQAEMEAIDAEHEALEAELEAREVQLRLAALLESSEGRTVLHLDGYDNLAKGEIERRDRRGIDLSDAERERLAEQWQQTTQLAAAAEQVRLEQKELRDAIREQVARLDPRLARILEAAEAIETQLKEVDRDFFDEMQRDLESFAGKVEEAAEDLGEELAEKARRIPATWTARTESASKLPRLAGRVVATLEDWESARPAQAVELAMETASIIEELETQLRGFDAEEWLDAGQTTLADVVDSVLDDDEQEAKILILLESEEAERLSAKLEQLAEVWRAGEELIAAVSDVVVQLPEEVEGEISSPGSFPVPLNDIKETVLDLTRTSRQENDRITIRADLLRKGESKPIDHFEASFETKYFGWRGRLSPAVVLARPTQLQGQSEDFTFAPVLTWLHSYQPRPEQTGFFAATSRLLQPGVGIHAAFVNFDSSTEVEIGLGATLSFWDGRLQGGAGIDLMSDASDDGRYYFFVGSDLISLLNTIGIGGGASGSR